MAASQLKLSETVFVSQKLSPFNMQMRFHQSLRSIVVGTLQPQIQKCPNFVTKTYSPCIRRRSFSIISSAEGSQDSMATAGPVIKVAAIAGSLRKASFNRGLIRYAIEIAKESIPNMEMEALEIGYLPFINTDLEVNNTFPQVVEDFRAKVLKADSILFASPEYNYSVPPPLKNAIDWASRAPNVWADKPAALMSAGGAFGGGLAQYQLRQIGVFLDLHFINKPELRVHAFQPPAKFDSHGNLVDNDTKDRVKAILLSLYAFTVRLQNRQVLS